MAAAIALALVAGCSGTDRSAPATADSAGADQPDDPGNVVLETTLGRVVFELYPERAPAAVRNFVQHVRSGFYDGLVFHRVIDGFMIQTGVLTPGGARRTSPVFPIPNENPNGLGNERGTVAMARTPDPHSATSEFFINLVDNRERLDFRDSTAAGFGYTVFGRVIEGMDVVDSVAAIPVSRQGRYEALPDTFVVIERAYIE